MATPFPFVAGAVLTAAQLNSITELVINDKTASYTLVAGDAGEYVVMNSASATTITVNNSIFAASQVIYIVNKGTAATTITAGAGVTISTSGSLVVPANGSGRLLALSASAFIYEAGDGAKGILQIVYASTSTSASSSTNTFVDTGLTATITPRSTSSNIVAIVNIADCSKDTGNTGLSLRLVRDSTTILNFAGDAAFTNDTSRNDVGSVGCVYSDSPNTTSATTYKVQFRSNSNTAVVYVQRGSTASLSTMLLCEFL